jgi:hypothetical protein
MNRQSLPPLIVGVISVGSGLWVALQLRADRCIDAAGRWDALRRTCVLPDGVPAQTMAQTVRDHLIGGAVAIAFAYMLLRMWTAIVEKNARRAEREAAAAAAAAGTTTEPSSGA